MDSKPLTSIKKQIRENGYDIKENAKELEKIYMRLIENK